MNESDKARVSVRLLEKEYQVACSADERADLLASADYLNHQMRELRDRGNVVGLDRIAVIAALNMANQLLKVSRTEAELIDDANDRLRSMRKRLESAIGGGSQLEL